MHQAAILGTGFAFALFALASDAAAASHFRDIYRVDRVSAYVEKNRLVVEASGAVNSGGWSHPRLRVKPSAPEAHVLEMDFIADPPSPKRVVIQQTLPIATRLTAGLPKYGTFAVSIASQTNTITTEIRR